MKEPYFSLRSDHESSHFVFANPETGIEAKSEQFATRQLAMRGINEVRENCESLVKYEYLEAENQQPYFKLKNSAGHVLLTSSNFFSDHYRRRICELLVNYGRNAKVY